MDKEALESMTKSLDTVGEILADKHLDKKTKEALAQLTLNELKELGYRKPPEDKPPLLSKSNRNIKGVKMADRIKVAIERGKVGGSYVWQSQFFITPWFDSRLEIKIDKIGEIVDAKTGRVVGEFKLKNIKSKHRNRNNARK